MRRRALADLAGHARLALVAVALAAAGCLGATVESSAPVDQSASGSWTRRAPMPSARQEVAVAALGPQVYVIGGFGDGAQATAAVERYDIATDAWEVRAPLPHVVHHAAAAVVGDRLYVVGGYTGRRLGFTPVASLHEYDPTRDAWIERAPMPTARGALAVAVAGNRLHALGGTADGVTGAHEVYDPAANRWTAAAVMPTARDHLTAVTVGGRVWVLGGRTSFFGTQFARVEIYDPATDSWRIGRPLPEGRGGLAAAAIGDRVYVFGGEAPLRIFSASEMYETAGDRWIAKTAMPTPRHGIGAAVVGGSIYIPGGATSPGLARTDVHEVFTP
jgi:N-acetylneuraminic acid mutarotase